MKLMKLKKKCIVLSLVLILVGALVSLVGFGTAGFNYDQLRNNTIGDSWYQTVHISKDNQWYGIDLGNNFHIMSIGYPE
jgi:hypothetical protein